MFIHNIEELPCVKCLIRPMCSNKTDNDVIKCEILAEFIRKYSKPNKLDIKVTDLVTARLQKQLLYIYNKINDRSSK